MKTDLRYAASECFETFPFPRPNPRTKILEVDAIGERVHQLRSIFMVGTSQGLTKTYNALKDAACDDPRVLELRRLHEEMDRAVLDAYGWTDILVPPYCPNNDSERAAVKTFADDVIDRLFLLSPPVSEGPDFTGITGDPGSFGAGTRGPSRLRGDHKQVSGLWRS